jgi:hypothetical protein
LLCLCGNASVCIIFSLHPHIINYIYKYFIYSRILPANALIVLSDKIEARFFNLPCQAASDNLEQLPAYWAASSTVENSSVEAWIS